MDETTQELEARLESLYSESEELQAEYDCRLDALQDYISDEEDELGEIERDIRLMNEEIKEIEARIGK
jgi:peptidoglycan hydrolase CwlO-like protein